MDIYSETDIWNLIQLGHELDEIASKLDCLASQLNRGVVDHELYDETRSQIKKCGIRLDNAFRSHAPRRP